MKSYSKKSPYSNRFVPGLLLNGRRRPNGRGWVEIGEKVVCPDPQTEEPPRTISPMPVPVSNVLSPDGTRFRIISQNNGLTLYSDYFVDFSAMTDVQKQSILRDKLSSWGEWTVYLGVINFKPYMDLGVTEIQILSTSILLPLPGNSL